ncbi:type II secretion system F family protein [Spiractinospora alimapuensis]|uniref:type II secretion system F family protein n=1 Tax=Spiractinospora alimapuensis TaxID=2820884 RepID=UPI001F4857CF|nr:type II secretion system F family protein [Spiractinospora alimapuensis]QVQ50361.1 type II secretion system F family protein [Spiractinospora alimapuensis]
MSVVAAVTVGLSVAFLLLPTLSVRRLRALESRSDGSTASPRRGGPADVASVSRRERARRIDEDAPTAFAMLGAALRAGVAVPSALAIVGDALPGPLGEELRMAADHARLGADPTSAWDAAPDSALTELGRTLTRASTSGAPVADLLDQAASDRRRTTHTNARARAHRAGVLVVLPLGLCFLPAFVLIGIAPLAAGLLLDLA